MTGWPWPLGGVQDWFEDLPNVVFRGVASIVDGIADTLGSAIEGVSTAVWTALPTWIRDGLLFLGELAGQVWNVLWDFVRDPIGSIQAGLNWVVNSVGATLTAMSTAIGGVATGVWTALPDWVRGPLEFLKDLAGQAWTTLWNFMRDPIGSIQAGLNWVATTVTTAFDGALSTFGSWVEGALRGMATAMGSALQGMITWLSAEIPRAVGVVVQFAQAHIIDPIVSGLQWLFGRLADIVSSLISTIEGLFAHHSPITPEQALPIGIGVVAAVVGAGALATGLADVVSTKLVGTGLDLKAIGGYITAVINPGMFMGAVLGVIVGVGIRTPLTQFYNRQFRPAIPAIEEAQRMLWRGKIDMGQFRDIVARSGFGDPYEDGFVELTRRLPGSGDLIRFVVREVIPFSTFDDFMAMQGFSLEISGWYWEAHWVLPSTGNLIDAFHRGKIDRGELNTYIVLHDFKPEPRPGIRVSDQTIMTGLTKTLIPRVDLRYAWEMGRISDEELDDRYVTLGYEEDSRLMADIQKMRALTEEIHKVRDEWIRDFLEGHIFEDVLRANLAEIGIGPARIEYYVSYAKMRREREHNKRLLDIYEDAYQKDLKTYEELETDAATIITDPDALDLFLTEAWIRKFKKPKGD